MREKPSIRHPLNIREEELKNRMAAMFFGKYDCTRIVGNIDFCVSPKRRDPRQMTFIPDTPILWAEAKNHPTDIYRMLAQLILTIKGELKGDIEPPRFLGCFDSEKIAFVEYHYVLPVFNLNDFNWTQTPSAVDEKTVATVRGVIPQDKIVVFRFGADDAEIKAFIARNFASGDSPALATPIDRNNFTFIYQKWRSEVMPHIDAPWDVLKRKYALYDRDFFLAEMNIDDNGTPEPSDDRPAEDFYITFNANAKEPYTIRRKTADELNFNLVFGFKHGGLDAYSAFWRRYKRPPKREYWDFIVSRLDLLVPQDVRERKGSFFTPAIWVEKSQEYLAAALGEKWQDEYYVWDCAGGTGNLEVGLTNKYRVWVSTLDQQDVDVIHERIKNGANLLASHAFRFDFLNDPFDKLPEDLRDVINDPDKRKRLVIYINPPYAEAATTRAKIGTGDNKPGVAASHSANKRYKPIIGAAANELFALFLMRIHDEISGCVIGQFSTLKHLQAPNFKHFRQAFRGALEKCFLVPADTFDNVKGKFPIGFFVWRLGGNVSRGDAETRSVGEPRFVAAADGTKPVPPIFTSTVADVYDRDGESLGTKKLFSSDGAKLLMDWIRQFYDKSGERLAYCRYLGSDFQNNNGVFITLNPSANDLKQVKGNWITKKNLVPFCVYFAVRLCIDADWLNDRDQFHFPEVGWHEDGTFLSDCAIWTLFSTQNRVSSHDGVNHWIPFTEEEVGAKSCFKSHFMSDILGGRVSSLADTRRVEDNAPYQGELNLSSTGAVAQGEGKEECQPSRFLSACEASEQNRSGGILHSAARALSPAARAVLDAGRELWRYYHAQPDANPNASFYDIKFHFQGSTVDVRGKAKMNSESSDGKYTELLANLKAAMKNLAARIEPKVYEYGFLKW